MVTENGLVRTTVSMLASIFTVLETRVTVWVALMVFPVKLLHRSGS